MALAIILTLAISFLFNFRLVNAMIAIHVVLGSLAFIIGGVTLFSKKGSPLHKMSGKLFFWTMTLSAVYTLIVSTMPNHISPSMFQISIMTLYFLIGGLRSILFKRPNHNLLIDKIMAYVVIIISFLIFLYSVVLYGEFNPLRTVFGAVAIVFGTLDLWSFNKPKSLKKYWLLFHLSKMLAGYTTAITGFFVAQNILSGYFNWFTPTVVCLIYIIFWTRKLKTFKPSSSL